MSETKIKTAASTPIENGRESSECPGSFRQAGRAHKPDLKYVRVLRRLLNGPLNRFEAENFPVSDHTLPSTVSELKRRGVVIHAQLIRLPGYSGKGAHVAEYSLAEESRQHALKLIGAG